MAYIANKPVRFDRDYRIGEVIPEDVIAPSMTRKLMEMGRILHVALPQDGTEDALAKEDMDVSSNGAFICEVCSREFNSQQALAAHSRSHKDQGS